MFLRDLFCYERKTHLNCILYTHIHNAFDIDSRKKRKEKIIHEIQIMTATRL